MGVVSDVCEKEGGGSPWKPWEGKSGGVDRIINIFTSPSARQREATTHLQSKGDRLLADIYALDTVLGIPCACLQPCHSTCSACHLPVGDWE